ncbi:uncharacterized protein F4807DRAFT_28940 [Annulohypoxylon truncatum]|uniref:uncharacterized protein n=1 Tax=Annulohypoxylon truncatum TaxID=327061 RepID=UPI002007C5F5|nr:uncharacterized protein F4807DRAFT_28940 [Annulohypoxylon truncatum]KAI1211209.1 hypothetical protein F4807DRAFT_28940 [Annulohypoxylon truncatum]
MSWTKTNQFHQLHALLAMPASLRLVLVGNTSRLRFSPTYNPLTNLRHYASRSRNRKGNSAEIAAFSLPEFSPAGTTPVGHISHEELDKKTILTPFRHLPLDQGLRALFINSTPKLWDSTADFYLLRKNTRVPEVAILGRSNVGKSSFINGVSHTFRSTLAPTSQKAGRTKSIRLYGFGPPPTVQDFDSQAPMTGPEKPHQYSLYVADTPGYGENSLIAWGDHVKLYLEKRANLKGVIVLIDGVVGPKRTDAELFKLLCSLEMRTSIVLTKVDKALEWVNRLRLTCRNLEILIRKIRKEQVEKNWIVDWDVYVTACDARDSNLLHATLKSARIAVVRQAGMVEDNLPETDRNKKWSGDIVSFEDLQYKTDEDAPTTAPEAKVVNTPPEIRAAPEKKNVLEKKNAPKNSFSFAELERASSMQQRVRPRFGRSRFFHTSSDVKSMLEPQSKAFVRKFHSATKKHGSSQSPSRKTDEDVFDAFINDLRYSSTKGNYARNVRDSLNKNNLPPMPPLPPKRIRKRTPEIAGLASKLKVKRLKLAEIEREREVAGTKQRGGTKAKKAPIDDDDWPAMPQRSSKKKGSGGLGDIMSPDAFKTMVTSSDIPPEMEELTGSKKKKRGKKSKSKSKKSKAGRSEPLDPFEAKFGDAFTASKQKIPARSSF